MSDRIDNGPLQLGERAPNFVLDAITRDGKVAIDDFPRPASADLKKSSFPLKLIRARCRPL